MAFPGITFKPNFVELHHLIQKFKGDTSLVFSLRTKNRQKFVAILHRSKIYKSRHVYYFLQAPLPTGYNSYL